MFASAGGNHGTSQSPYRRVLVGWDASPDSVAALRAATSLACTAAQGCVVAMAVLADTRGSPENGDEAGSPAHRMNALFESARASMELPAGAVVSLHTAEGSHPARSLCEYAHTHSFDLVVLGRHGNEGIFHPKLGHVAHAVAKSSQVPVLLVSDPARFRYQL